MSRDETPLPATDALRSDPRAEGGAGTSRAGRAERGRRDARDYYAVKSHLAARRIVAGCGNTEHVRGVLPGRRRGPRRGGCTDEHGMRGADGYWRQYMGK